jgi:hypothetical protein
MPTGPDDSGDFFRFAMDEMLPVEYFDTRRDPFPGLLSSLAKSEFLPRHFARQIHGPVILPF